MLVIGDKSRSQYAAEATECAADQGYFWAYHDLLFANQKDGATWSRNVLKTYAKNLGLDTQAFGQCMDSKKYASKVTGESSQGYKVPGITGTPSFLVNGKLIQLQKSYDEVIAAIQSEVK